jgi:hypothetical protein
VFRFIFRLQIQKFTILPAEEARDTYLETGDAMGTKEVK